MVATCPTNPYDEWRKAAEEEAERGEMGVGPPDEPNIAGEKEAELAVPGEGGCESECGGTWASVGAVGVWVDGDVDVDVLAPGVKKEMEE